MDSARGATTPTVEESKAIDVTRFTDAVEQPGASGAAWKGDRADPEWWIKVHLESDPTDDRATALRLQFTVTDHRTDEQREYDYLVPLEYTECNFGGERPWFRCPGVVDGEACNRRVGKLYCPPGRDLFLCRHCYDLGYRSSRESGDDMKKALRRFQRAQENLGVGPSTPESGSYDDLYPDRPKGMHHSTYEELLTELDAAREEWYATWRAELDAMHEHVAGD